ncbi:hypothetical protein I41_21520 [Lacipirellula limnantheis]|uniref:Uncharacterized protein n=1 Tax=Lacipirellula limnantheis TaxID=2528024 RepID=A0A517TX59_9BACT|nr:hypothetical protein I41_21520 [Lacipirellula limnantheis]
MSLSGLESNDLNTIHESNLGDSSFKCAAFSGAVSADLHQVQAETELLVCRWPTLPSAVRQRILELAGVSHHD